MKKAGVHILWDFIELSSIGLIESLLPGLRIALKLRGLKAYLRDHPVDIVVLIDNQGMNIPIARIARKLTIPVIYYFPPQVSIWGKWNARKLAQITDLILCPFAKDALIYKKAGGKAVYVGHPMKSIVQVDQSKEKIAQSLYISTPYVIGLFPGSRRQEIKTLFPIMLETAQQINNKRSVTFLIPVSSSVFLPMLQRILLAYRELNIVFIEQGDYNGYQLCDCAIAASGTATLELTLLKVPVIAVYKLNLVSYLLAKAFIRGNCIALPNILLEDQLVPELIQRGLNPDTLYHMVEKILNSLKTCLDKQNQFDRLASLLGEDDPVRQTADEILSMLNRVND